jgi:hypothetical protein
MTTFPPPLAGTITATIHHAQCFPHYSILGIAYRTSSGCLVGPQAWTDDDIEMLGPDVIQELASAGNFDPNLLAAGALSHACIVQCLQLNVMSLGVDVNFQHNSLHMALLMYLCCPWWCTMILCISIGLTEGFLAWICLSLVGIPVL